MTSKMAANEPWILRFRLRGRRQGQLLELPQETDRSSEGGRSYRVRQHPMERLRGGAA